MLYEQFYCEPTAFFSENKENIFEIHTYQELCPLSLPLYKTSQLKLYLSFFGKLFIFTLQLFNKIWFHELPFFLTWYLHDCRDRKQQVIMY